VPLSAHSEEESEEPEDHQNIKVIHKSSYMEEEVADTI